MTHLWRSDSFKKWQNSLKSFGEFWKWNSFWHFLFWNVFFQFINVFLVCLIKWVIVNKWMSDDLYQVLMWKSTWMTLINDIGVLKNEVIGWQSDIVLGGCPKNRVTKIVIESWTMGNFDPLKDGWVKSYFEDISVCDCFWRV